MLQTWSFRNSSYLRRTGSTMAVSSIMVTCWSLPSVERIFLLEIKWENSTWCCFGVSRIRDANSWIETVTWFHDATHPFEDKIKKFTELFHIKWNLHHQISKDYKNDGKLWQLQKLHCQWSLFPLVDAMLEIVFVNTCFNTYSTHHIAWIPAATCLCEQ